MTLVANVVAALQQVASVFRYLLYLPTKPADGRYLLRLSGGVATWLLSEVSGCVADGATLALDNIKVSPRTSANNGVQVGTVVGTAAWVISGLCTYGQATDGVGVYASQAISFSASTVLSKPFGWIATGYAGNMQILFITDKTNGKFYRVSIHSGGGGANSWVSIERLG